MSGKTIRLILFPEPRGRWTVYQKGRAEPLCRSVRDPERAAALALRKRKVKGVAETVHHGSEIVSMRFSVTEMAELAERERQRHG